MNPANLRPTRCFTGRTLIQVENDEHYVLSDCVFSQGSVTTVMWTSGLVEITRCEVHQNATLVVSGGKLCIGSDNYLHSSAVVCGNVMHLITSIKVNELLNCIKMDIYVGEGEGEGWSDKELDRVSKGRVVNYMNPSIRESQYARFIARMCVDYGFTVFPALDLPIVVKTRRDLVRSLLVMVSARDAKRIGTKSALRVLPRYILISCAELLL